MSALGHKQTFSPILPQRPVPGANQPFDSDESGEKSSSDCECPLSPIADVRIKRKQGN